MRRTRYYCVAVIFVIVATTLCALFIPATNREEIRDDVNRFTLELPRGFYVRPDLIQRMRDIESTVPDVFPVEHMIAASASGSPSTMPQVASRAWDGPLARNQLDRIAGAGISGTFATRWKSHNLKGWYSDVSPNGVTVVSTIVPLKPSAIQIDVGVVTDFADGMRLLETLLDKLAGETNWDEAAGDSVNTK